MKKKATAKPRAAKKAEGPTIVLNIPNRACKDTSPPPTTPYPYAQPAPAEKKTSSRPFTTDFSITKEGHLTFTFNFHGFTE